MSGATRLKYATTYHTVIATAQGGAPVRVALRGRDRRTVEYQIRRYLRPRGYDLHARQVGDALLCRAERRPVKTAMPVESVLQPVRIIRYAPDGTALDERVIPAAQLAGEPERRTIAPHIPKTAPPSPTVRVERERGRSWASNSF